MAMLIIRHNGDPVLRKKSKKVAKIDPLLLQLLDDMAETMYAAPGIGLAAPQVGVNVRAIVVDVGDADEGGGLRMMINPKVVASSEEIEAEAEGCLSVPGYQGMVERPEAVIVKAMGPDGKYYKLDAEGILARCLQHEIDHLDGILYIDKATAIWEPVDEEEAPEEGQEADEQAAADEEPAPVPVTKLKQQEHAIFQVNE
jgi:peptide deformylase